MRLNERTLAVPVSPIATAYEHLRRAPSSVRLLDLSQAAPSYPTAPRIVERIEEVASSSDGGRYAPSPGLPELREALAAELCVDHGLSTSTPPISASNVQITAGCNQAFCATISALAAPGDEVIIGMPFYFNHDMWLRLEGIVPRYLAADATQIPRAVDAAELINERTRAIVVVSPGNPTGAIVPPDELAAFYDLAQRHGIALLLDETYRRFRGTDAPSHDLYGRADWAETLVTLHSFSKDLAIPGYRVGALVAAPELCAEILKLVDCMAICAPRVGQEAALCGLLEAGDWRRAQAARIGARLDSFRQAMADAPGGFELVSSGAFFGWVRHPFPQQPTSELVERLVVDHAVLAIPGNAFTPTDDSWLRVSFANLEPDDFLELADRLERAGAALDR